MTQLLHMTTKPKHLKRGHHYFWKQVLDIGKSGTVFTCADIHRRCRCVDRSTVLDYLKRLVKGGYLTSKMIDKQLHFQLVKVAARTPSLRRDGTPTVNGQQFMWTAMRQLKQFTLADVQVASRTEAHNPTKQTVKSYIKALHMAGILVGTEIAKGKPWIYRFTKDGNTGPNAPSILRTKAIYDPNRDLILGEAETVEG